MVGVYQHNYLETCFYVYVKAKHWFLIDDRAFHVTANQSHQNTTLNKLAPKELTVW